MEMPARKSTARVKQVARPSPMIPKPQASSAKPQGTKPPIALARAEVDARASARERSDGAAREQRVGQTRPQKVGEARGSARDAKAQTQAQARARVGEQTGET